MGIGFVAKLFLGWFPKLSPQGARRISIAVLLLAAVVGLLLAWHFIISGIIKRHDREQDAGVVTNTAAANTNAAETRATDNTRLTIEKREAQEAIDHAKAVGTDPRAAYYHCIELQQSARKAGSPTPDC